jgi:putative ABC transport system permease protein
VLKLVRRNLLRHPVRSLLTMGSLVVALFLLCFLTSVVTTLEAGVQAASSKRLWVQSAVSLFVQLPTSYQAKIDSVPGVRRSCMWQWFGGYYQDPSNFFAQFAVEPDKMLAMYQSGAVDEGPATDEVSVPEIEIVAGSGAAWIADRTGCVVGEGLATQFGWEVGDTVPIIGALFPRADGSAWEFRVDAIYRPLKPGLDDRTLFFQWDYFAKSMEEIHGESPDVGALVVEIESGADPTAVMAGIDGLFENGPQRVQTTTEAEFQRQFVSMIGNLPRFIGFIGAGVLAAILLACVNTMLMAAREQVHEVGILKSLGFADAQVFGLMIGQSLLLCVLGGGLGLLGAKLAELGIGKALGAFFPGYRILPETLWLGFGLTVAVGIVAGLVPAWSASRLHCVEALRRA